jgi:hypothetical protein
MNEPAVIQGTFADLKVVKTRKTCQIVVEVPLEMLATVIRHLGGIDPGAETPVVVARLNSVPAAKPSKPDAPLADKPKGKKLAQRAAMLCNEPAFRLFLADRGVLIPDADAAVVWLRQTCGVQSRAELDSNEAAGRCFLDLEADYKLWRDHPDIAEHGVTLMETETA